MFKALLRKELQLQRSSLLFALALMAVWVVMMALTPQAGRGVFEPSSRLTIGAILSVCQTIFIGPCLLVVVPLLVGAAMVAEERRLGAWEWHLSLPAPRATQWAIKVAVGAAIVLALTFLVQPAMDALLARALGGERLVKTPSELPRLSPAYVWFPMLLMAGAAFVSSLTSDPYKAFFGGLLVAGATLLMAELTDPAHLLLQPWILENSAPILARYVSYGWATALVPVLSLALVGLTWFNFRYEAPRGRRLALELIALAVFCVAAGAFAVHRTMSPLGLVTQDVTQMASMKLLPSVHLGEAKLAPWITPLIAKRAAGSRSRRAIEFQTDDEMFSSLYRLPGSSRILVELKSLQRRGHNVPWQQIVEVDVESGGLRSIDAVAGTISRIDAEHDAYWIRFGRDYLVTRWPLPFKADGLFARLWSRGKQLSEDPMTVFSELYSSKEIVVDGESHPGYIVDNRDLRRQVVQPIDEQAEFAALTVGDAGPTSATWLIRRRADGTWTRVDRALHSDRGYYVLSSDRKWYAVQPNVVPPPFDLSQTASLPPLPSELRIAAVNASTTWSLPVGDGALWFATGHEDWRPGGITTSLEDRRLGNTLLPRPRLEVSASGRYLAFARVKTLSLDFHGEAKNTGFPISTRIRVLDLETGRESDLSGSVAMDPSLHTRFGRILGSWYKTQSSDQPVDTLFPQYGTLRMPPMVWAPTKERLAILTGDSIAVCATRGDAIGDSGPTGGLRPTGEGIVPMATIMLGGFQLRDLDFWDDDTLLAWGALGLFKIELDKIEPWRPGVSVLVPRNPLPSLDAVR